MKNKSVILTLAILIIALSSYAQTLGTFKDPRDGKTYKTIKIGTQTWMTKNLAYNPANGNFWIYENLQSNLSKYGCLYDFETAKNVCPSGWHLPSDLEWTVLIDFLGGESVAGGKMKATTVWNNPNKGATNKCKFSAIPAGFHVCDDDSFMDLDKAARFWSSTPDSTYGAWGREIYYRGREIYRNSYSFSCGYSVRCIKD